MKELIEPCKSCLGCSRLEQDWFYGDKNCKYSKEVKDELGEKTKQ